MKAFIWPSSTSFTLANSYFSEAHDDFSNVFRPYGRVFAFHYSVSEAAFPTGGRECVENTTWLVQEAKRLFSSHIVTGSIHLIFERFVVDLHAVEVRAPACG